MSRASMDLQRAFSLVGLSTVLNNCPLRHKRANVLEYVSPSIDGV